MLKVKSLIKKFSDKLAAKQAIKIACKIIDDESKSGGERLQAQIDMLIAGYYLATTNGKNFNSEMLSASIDLLAALKKAEQLAEQEAQQVYIQSMKDSFSHLPQNLKEKMDVEIMDDGEWDFPVGYFPVG